MRGLPLLALVDGNATADEVAVVDAFARALGIASSDLRVLIRLTPATTGHRGHFEPERVLRALRRGIACTIDPTDGWDPWPVIDRPLDELRAEYHIEPL